jgi:hypothetical protein
MQSSTANQDSPASQVHDTNETASAAKDLDELL